MNVGLRWLECFNRGYQPSRALVLLKNSSSMNENIFVVDGWSLLHFRSLIDQYFGGTFDVELKCTETDDEQVTKNKEQFLQLSCFISQDVRYMHSGLRSVC
jgi:hypothetical protein